MCGHIGHTHHMCKYTGCMHHTLNVCTSYTVFLQFLYCIYYTVCTYTYVIMYPSFGCSHTQSEFKVSYAHSNLCQHYYSIHYNTDYCCAIHADKYLNNTLHQIVMHVQYLHTVICTPHYMYVRILLHVYSYLYTYHTLIVHCIQMFFTVCVSSVFCLSGFVALFHCVLS